MSEYRDFADLLGKTFIQIANSHKEIIFYCDNGDKYVLYHEQNCCEHVYVEDIIGDISDLVYTPILFAEETSDDTNPEGIVREYQDSFTWTFYKLATIKGWVDIRWYGESNGYYSESVSLKYYKGGTK